MPYTALALIVFAALSGHPLAVRHTEVALDPHDIQVSNPAGSLTESGGICILHWKQVNLLKEACKADWNQWKPCSPEALSRWEQAVDEMSAKDKNVLSMAATRQKCGAALNAAIMRKFQPPEPDKNKECYPTELAFKAPKVLDPNEMPPAQALQAADFVEWYKREDIKAVFDGEDFTPIKENADVSWKETPWLYNTMMVVSNDDYDGELRNLMTSLLQPVPDVVMERAKELERKMRKATSVKPEGQMLLSRMGPSDSLQRNKDGAQDAWKKADEFLRQKLRGGGELEMSPAGLIDLMKSAHAIMLPGQGGYRQPGEETPWSGGPAGFNDREFYCLSKIPGAQQRRVSTRPDGDPLLYLDSIVVEKALLLLSAYVVKKMMDETEHVIIVAARFMMGIASIHPFHDGNGRIARLMMDFLFFAADLQPPTDYNAMLAVFPRAEVCWQPSPVAAANEIMRGLHSTYGLQYTPLPAAKDKRTYCPAAYPKQRVTFHY